MYDQRVYFDNNIVERAIRTIKVKQKVPGEFRSDKGALMFCRIRGNIYMVRKNSLLILEAVNAALLNRPFMPQQ